MYKIEKNFSKHRIITTFTGDYQYDSVVLIAELKNAALAVKSPQGYFDSLGNFTNAPAMPQDHARQSQELLAWMTANGLRKAANVMGTIVQRMQIKRLSDNGEKFQNFASLIEAEEWLDQ